MKFNIYCERCKESLFEAELFEAEKQCAYIKPHDCRKRKDLDVPRRRVSIDTFGRCK